MISVIIPIFNGEKHIMNCYNSLLSQTLKDWEAIFIDDGSTDQSYDILKSIDDSRIKIIHKSNEGVAVARERGIQASTKEYLTFLDIDDTLENNALKTFIEALDIEGVDVVIGGINIVSEKKTFIKSIRYNPIIVNGSRAVDYMCRGDFRWQLCGKAYRTQLFNDVVTPRGMRSAEDMAVCIQAVAEAKKVAVLRECLYNYIQVTTSVTHSKALETLYDTLKSALFVNKVIGKKISKISIDCLFLLIISGALRAGIANSDCRFQDAVKEHGKFRAIIHLPLLKGLNICLFRYFKINLARYI